MRLRGASNRSDRGGALGCAVLAAAVAAATGCSSSSSSGGFHAAAHTPYPALPTGGGPTLEDAHLVAVTFAGDPNAAALTAFVQWLASSNWLASTLSEYGVRSVVFDQQVQIQSSAPATLASGDVAALLTSATSAGLLPAPAALATTYVVFLPDGTTATTVSGNACTSNPGNGFHDALPGGSVVPYVVVPNCDPRFSALLDTVGGMQLETARLLADALTDPSPLDEPAYALTDNANPWTAMGSEVGDLCWGRLVTTTPYVLQRIWSNRAATTGGDPCLPTPPSTVAFGVTTSPSGLQTLSVGAPATFAVTGWSNAALPDWAIQATPWIGDFAIQVNLDSDHSNNGEMATLTVTVPYAVPTGTYGAVRLQSTGPNDAPSWPVAFLVRSP